ncbi:MAG: hypothetical protein ACPL3C_02455 [Pyrobaculum sp.]
MPPTRPSPHTAPHCNKPRLEPTSFQTHRCIATLHLALKILTALTDFVKKGAGGGI